MRKIITIAILFFSYSGFSQARLIDKEAVGKVEALGTCSTVVSNEEANSNDTMINNGTANYSSSYAYRRSTNEITENPLYNIKLALPSNFNWLLRSIV